MARERPEARAQATAFSPMARGVELPNHRRRRRAEAVLALWSTQTRRAAAAVSAPLPTSVRPEVLAALASGFSQTSGQQQVLAALALGSSRKLVLQRLEEPASRLAVVAKEPWLTLLPMQLAGVQALVQQQPAEAAAGEHPGPPPQAQEGGAGEAPRRAPYVQHLEWPVLAQVPYPQRQVHRSAFCPAYRRAEQPT